MIDNRQKAMALVLEMQKEIPFIVYPTEIVANILKEKHPHFNTNTQIKIEGVAYLGDKRGIMCHGFAELVDDVIAVSLTHLTLDTKSPFYKAAKTYQENRIKKLFLKNIGFGNLK